MPWKNGHTCFMGVNTSKGRLVCYELLRLFCEIETIGYPTPPGGRYLVSTPWLSSIRWYFDDIQGYQRMSMPARYNGYHLPAKDPTTRVIPAGTHSSCHTRHTFGRWKWDLCRFRAADKPELPCAAPACSRFVVLIKRGDENMQNSMVVLQ